MFLKFWELN
uniref:Uncharacterized protein n=1 Tax=Arundo donax TaxID=35708 RepID=A0A0A9BGZ7_ARUDO